MRNRPNQQNQHIPSTFKNMLTGKININQQIKSNVEENVDGKKSVKSREYSTFINKINNYSKLFRNREIEKLESDYWFSNFSNPLIETI